ncbi:uncharacterized protein LOC116188668 [Punica granatum]|uniref:Uncharacterized protein LOC116188668 n=1 Tax=Punica granatum TaxID=22663 RepID=A0A6P8BT46_PUNGR|nr:uncharacterized protein LOC116188668 [Punica granatum]
MNPTKPQQPGLSPPNFNMPGLEGTPCFPNLLPGTTFPSGASSNNQAALLAWLVSMMNPANPQQLGTSPLNFNLPGPGTSCFPNPPPGIGAPGGASSNNQAALWAWLVSKTLNNQGHGLQIPRALGCHAS